MLLLLFLLCSGFSHIAVASNRLRHFEFLGQRNIEDTLEGCNQTGGNLVTLYDDDDATFTVNFIRNKTGTRFTTAWLGLKHGRIITWSDGTAFNTNESPGNLKWETPICGAIENNNRTAFNCSKENFFMCYKDNNYTLIERPKNWCQALLYCKKHNANLASITNKTQIDKVIDEGKNKSFWIGVMYDEWQWRDKSCSKFRKWNTGQIPDDVPEWALLGSDGLMKPEEIGSPSDYQAFCSKGYVRIQVVNQSKDWEEALDHCRAKHSGLVMMYDDEDQKALEQWLEYLKVRPGQYWIGLRQSRVFGFWIWSDRTVNASNWKDDKTPQLPMSNPCGVINVPGYEWSDEDCSVQLPFICEEEIGYMNA